MSRRSSGPHGGPVKRTGFQAILARLAPDAFFLCRLRVGLFAHSAHQRSWPTLLLTNALRPHCLPTLLAHRPHQRFWSTMLTRALRPHCSLLAFNAHQRSWPTELTLSAHQRSWPTLLTNALAQQCPHVSIRSYIIQSSGDFDKTHALPLNDTRNRTSLNSRRVRTCPPSPSSRYGESVFNVLPEHRQQSNTYRGNLLAPPGPRAQGVSVPSFVRLRTHCARAPPSPRPLRPPRPPRPQRPNPVAPASEPSAPPLCPGGRRGALDLYGIGGAV